MCFICTVIKIKDAPELINPIVSMMLDEQNSNDDGTGAYCFGKGKKFESRKLSVSGATIAQNLNDFDVVNYHFRRSTGGTDGVHNVHFWRIGKWLFAHNGTIKSHEKDDDCDSLAFFKELVAKGCLGKKIDIEKIQKIVGETSAFWGRFILIDSSTNKMYFFGDFEIKLLNRSYMIVSSATADVSSKETFVELGITFETDNEVEIETFESKIDGVVMYDPKDGFSQLEDSIKIDPPKLLPAKGFDVANYYARGAYLDDDYPEGNTAFEAEYDEIQRKYSDKIKALGNDYSDEAIKGYEIAEIEMEVEVEELEERYFNIKKEISLPN